MNFCVRYFFGLFLIVVCLNGFNNTADEYFSLPGHDLSDLEDLEPSIIDEAYKLLAKDKSDPNTFNSEYFNAVPNVSTPDLRLSFRNLYAATIKPYLLTSTLEEVAQDWFLNTFIEKGSTIWRKNIQLAYDPYLQMGLKRLEWAHLAQTHPIEEKFLMYIPYQGISNQFLQLARAAVLAKSLNRTLIVPPMIPSEHQIDENEIKPILEAFNTTPLLPWDTMYNITEAWKKLDASLRFVPLTDGLLEYLLLPSKSKDVVAEFGIGRNDTRFLLNNSSSSPFSGAASSLGNYPHSKIFQPEPKYYEPPFENTFMGRRSTLLFGYDGKMTRENGKFTQGKKLYFNSRYYGKKILVHTYGKWQSAESLGVSSQLFFGAYRLNPSFQSIPVSSPNIPKIPKLVKTPMRFSQVHSYFSSLSNELLLCISNLQHLSMNGAENSLLHAVSYSDFMIKIGLDVNKDIMASPSVSDSVLLNHKMSPYIGIHWRAGDWQGACSVGEAKDKARCYPSIDLIQHSVSKVRQYFSRTDIMSLSEEVNSNQTPGLESEIELDNYEILESGSNIASKLVVLEDPPKALSYRNDNQNNIFSPQISTEHFSQIQSIVNNNPSQPKNDGYPNPFHVSSLYVHRDDPKKQPTFKQTNLSKKSPKSQIKMQVRLATNEDSPGQLALFSSLGYKTFSKSGLEKLFTRLEKGIDDLLGQLFSYQSLSVLYNMQQDKTLRTPTVMQQWYQLHKWISSMTFHQLDFCQDADFFEKCYTLLKNSLLVQKDNIRSMRWKNILQNELNLPENAYIQEQKFCNRWDPAKNQKIKTRKNNRYKSKLSCRKKTSLANDTPSFMMKDVVQGLEGNSDDGSYELQEPLAFSPYTAPAKALYSSSFRPISDMALDSASGLPLANSDSRTIGISQAFCRLAKSPQLNPIILSLAPFLPPMVDTITLALSDGFIGNSYSTFSKAINLRRRFMIKSVPRSKYAFYLSQHLSDDKSVTPCHQNEKEQNDTNKSRLIIPISSYF